MLANPPLVDDVRRTLLDAPEFLAELGISPGDVYAIVYEGAPAPKTTEYMARVRASRVKHVGQGFYAHVFSLPSGMVLKVTYDDNDAQAAELIRTAARRGEPTPGLPRIEKVKRLPTRTRDAGWAGEPPDQWLYAIVVEPLTPLVAIGTWGMKSWLQWRVKEGLWRTADALTRSSEYREAQREQVPVAAKDPDFAAEIDEGLQGVKWLRERGFHVLDLHTGNFGKTKDGRTVLLDFGHWSKQLSRKTVPVRMAKNPKIVGFVANPLPIDNNVETGIGATGFNQDADYFGLRVLMRPSVFHRLTLTMTREQARSVDWMKEKVAERKGFGAPTLYVDIPEGWDDGDFSEPAIVNGHEGRNRMWASRELYGDDDPVETHIFPRGGRRNRDITAEWIERMNLGMVSQRRRGYVQAPHRVWAPPTSADETKGPLFEKVLNAQSGRMSGHAFARNPGASMPHVRASFDRHFDESERVFPDLGTIELHEDDAAGSDNGAGSERQFGYCADEKPIVIAFAPKAETLPKRYIDGLMAHEFGHAIEFRYGRKHLEKLWGRLPDSIERRADKIAEHTFGRSIEYGNLDIQCIGCGGKKVRPRRLG